MLLLTFLANRTSAHSQPRLCGSVMEFSNTVHALKRIIVTLPISFQKKMMSHANKSPCPVLISPLLLSQWTKELLRTPYASFHLFFFLQRHHHLFLR
ncbi:hypothetical protein AHF37_00024 [Paragonimus kellicotti]|nr:hypothetical protein AHF37_00024 [Paragonimus kellicotti]